MFKPLKLNHIDKIILSNNLAFTSKLLLGLFLTFILSNPILQEFSAMKNIFIMIYILFILLTNTFISLTFINNHKLLINSLPCSIIKKDVILTILKTYCLDLILFTLSFLLASIITKSLILPSAFVISIILLAVLEVLIWVEKNVFKKTSTIEPKKDKYVYIKRFIMFFLVYNIFRIFNFTNLYLIFESNSIIFWILNIVLCTIIINVVNNKSELCISKKRS